MRHFSGIPMPAQRAERSGRQSRGHLGLLSCTGAERTEGPLAALGRPTASTLIRCARGQRPTRINRTMTAATQSVANAGAARQNRRTDPTPTHSISPAVTLLPGQTIRITLASQGTPGIPWHFCIYNWYYCTDILDQEGMWSNWTNSTDQTISIDTLYAMTCNDPGTSTIEVSLEPSLLSDKTSCVLPAGR
jgi:hypothetical protein